jgi:hypothetical protein
MDVNVPFAITLGLRRRGIDVLTSQDDGTRSVSDEILLERATDLGRILVSHDRDVLKIAKQWQSAGRRFVGSIFAHQQGLGIGRCIDDLELIARRLLKIAVSPRGLIRPAVQHVTAAGPSGRHRSG